MTLEGKIVVFDLDETLGYFTQLYIFWKSINLYLNEEKINIELNQNSFNDIFDLFPEFIRPDIGIILNYLNEKKKTKKCKNVMIYTNNQRQKDWVFMIKRYFEKKINNELFDQIICAFKINGKQIELYRSTHNKTHKDFIKCSKIPENTQICFIDDTYFPDMHSSDVYYIKIKPYIYWLNINLLIYRFKKSKVFNNMIYYKKDRCLDFLREKMIENTSNSKVKSMKEYEIDKIITTKIMNHIMLFFNDSKIYSSINFNSVSKTKRNKTYKNKTKKLKRLDN